MALQSFKWVGVVAMAIVIFITGCTSTAHIEKDESTDFSKYKTYGWVNQPKAKGKLNRRNDMVEQQVKEAVNEHLQRSGWKESRKPDVWVTYDLLVERNQKEQKDPVYSDPYTRTFYNRYTRRMSTFYYPSQFMGYDSYTTTVKEGTVTITMIDSKTDKTVFQGWSTNELSKTQITGKEIDRTVASIFKKFDNQK